MASVLGRIAAVDDTLGRSCPYQHYAGHIPRGTSRLHAEGDASQSGCIIKGIRRTGVGNRMEGGNVSVCCQTKVISCSPDGVISCKKYYYRVHFIKTNFVTCKSNVRPSPKRMGMHLADQNESEHDVLTRSIVAVRIPSYRRHRGVQLLGPGKRLAQGSRATFSEYK